MKRGQTWRAFNSVTADEQGVLKLAVFVLDTAHLLLSCLVFIAFACLTINVIVKVVVESTYSKLSNFFFFSETTRILVKRRWCLRWTLTRKIHGRELEIQITQIWEF